jgi:hypothetical protein
MKRLLFHQLLVSALILSGFCAESCRAEEASQGIPSALESYRGVHPRLFLDAKGVDALKLKIQGTHKALWAAFIKEADKIVGSKPDTYRDDKGEQLWQRKVGNKISILAFAYLISRDKKYLEAGEAWATASCQYPTWGIDAKTGQPATQGLVYGHQLLGLAMLYDYAFADLDPATKELIYKTMVEKTTIEYPDFKARYALLQNHSWIKSTGMLAVGLALFDKEPRATDWIALPEHILDQSTKMLSPDGASQEGFGYWQYGVEYLLKLMELSKILGKDQFASPWWDHTADYCLDMMLPQHAWTKEDCQNDYADAARFAWYGPDDQLRALAARNHDGVAQWLADRIDTANVEEPLAPWLNLLFYDPAVTPMPLSSKPTLHYFDNMGLVSARSDWSGDESWLFFKAGNPLGKYAPDNFPDRLDPWDMGHVHRDANHFCLFGNGEWLIRNSTYANREAQLHNTLTVGDEGQLGDGKTSVWPLKPNQDFAHVVEAQSTPQLDRIIGEAAGAYPPSAGVKKFTRHLLFLKPDVLIVADDIEVSDEKKLDLFFHPEQEAVRQSDGSYRSEGKSATLRIEVLTPEGTSTSIVSQTLAASHSTPSASISALEVEKSGTTWRNAVALSWAAAGAEPIHVTLDQHGPSWIFSAGAKQAVLNWK